MRQLTTAIIMFVSVLFLQDYVCGDTDTCVEGVWGPWNAWGPCISTCTRTRLRDCRFAFESQCKIFCVGGQDEKSGNGECTDGACCVPGSWAQWNQWSNCTFDICGAHDISVRTRACDGKGDCPGNSPCEKSSEGLEFKHTRLCDKPTDCKPPEEPPAPPTAPPDLISGESEIQQELYGGMTLTVLALLCIAIFGLLVLILISAAYLLKKKKNYTIQMRYLQAPQMIDINLQLPRGGQTPLGQSNIYDDHSSVRGVPVGRGRRASSVGRGRRASSVRSGSVSSASSKRSKVSTVSDDVKPIYYHAPGFYYD